MADPTIADVVPLLDQKQKDNLSKALFPDTDTEHWKVLDVERTFKPLPIKYSKQINAALKPFFDKIQLAQKPGTDVDIDMGDCADDLVRVATIICQRYGWEDILEALKAEELTVDEIQGLVVRQTEVQQRNDFLLMSLRALVEVFQGIEMSMAMGLKLQAPTNSGQDS